MRILFRQKTRAISMPLNKRHWHYPWRNSLVTNAAIMLFCMVTMVAVPWSQARGEAPPAPLKAYNIKGFRSALFGMDEQEVIKSIAADFGVPAKAIMVEQHPVERTKILTIDVPNLGVAAGPARISYILGYSSNRLIQVSTIWGTAGVPGSKATLQDLDRAATDLMRYFSGFGFKQGSVKTNLQLADGSLLILEARDIKDHTLTLVLGAVTAPDSDPPTAEKSQENVFHYLRLSYIENIENPDILRINPGQF